MNEDPKEFQPVRPGRWFVLGGIVAAVAIALLTVGLIAAQTQRLNRQTASLSQAIAQGPRVLVAQVSTAPRSREIELPGTIHGFIETPVYAKISGYLKSINVDKGDRVHKGELLAKLESPELDHEVANARAAYDLALVTDARNQKLLRAAVIAQQSADDSHAQMLATRATLNQLIATQDYKLIRAPFDGIVTARYVDPGALIPQTTSPSTANTALLALATLAPLRIYADVPQSVAPFIKNGGAATITVTEYPGKIFEGEITRHPEALNAATRTMLAEVDLPNDDRALLPGMYAKVKFRLSSPAGPPLVPDDALIFRDGKTYVPIVRDNRLTLSPVTLGYDDGISVQITNGVAPNDVIALNVGQAARDGERVQPIAASTQ